MYWCWFLSCHRRIVVMWHIQQKKPSEQCTGLPTLSLQVFCDLKLLQNKKFTSGKIYPCELVSEKNFYITTKKYDNDKEFRFKPSALCLGISDFEFKPGKWSRVERNIYHFKGLTVQTTFSFLLNHIQWWRPTDSCSLIPPFPSHWQASNLRFSSV